MKFVKKIIKMLLQNFGFKLVKLSPMELMLLELEKHGIVIKDLEALEVFGWIGDMHTKDYARLVKTLDVWEYDEKCEEFLKANLPMANVKITNSFEEVKLSDRKFSFIVIDNPLSIYGSNQEYCEHFELFPDIFSIMQKESILVLNVIPNIREEDKQNYPYLFNNEHLKRRKAFYKKSDPQDISIDEMMGIYETYAENCGFNIEWFFTQKRSSVYYLAVKLIRSSKQ